MIVAAKNDETHKALSAAFEAHHIERAYLCLVWGLPSPAAGEITGNIGRHPIDRKRMAVVSRGGKPAVTHYRVVQSFGLGASLVECRLETGRTHQIRVHMTKIGHPLIGDPVYGKPTAARRGRLSPEARRAAEAFRGRRSMPPSSASTTQEPVRIWPGSPNCPPISAPWNAASQRRLGKIAAFMNAYGSGPGG